MIIDAEFEEIVPKKVKTTSRKVKIANYSIYSLCFVIVCLIMGVK